MKLITLNNMWKCQDWDLVIYNPFESEMLIEIANRYHKTVGQVLLRWNIQRGVVVIPKSTHVEEL